MKHVRKQCYVKKFSFSQFMDLVMPYYQFWLFGWLWKMHLIFILLTMLWSLIGCSSYVADGTSQELSSCYPGHFVNICSFSSIIDISSQGSLCHCYLKPFLPYLNRSLQSQKIPNWQNVQYKMNVLKNSACDISISGL